MDRPQPHYRAAGRGHRADRQHRDLYPHGGQAGGPVRPAVFPYPHEPLLQHPQGHSRGRKGPFPQTGRGWPEKGGQLPARHLSKQVGYPGRGECL